MKTINFIIFFSIFFTIYGLVNFYIFSRGWQALPSHSRLRMIYLIVFLFISLAFIAGRFMERVQLCGFSDFLIWVGSFWLAAMLYFFLIVLVLDILRMFNHFFPFFQYFISNYAQTKLVIFYTAIGIVVIAIIAGHLNALHPRVKKLELTISKKAAVQSLNIVAASDIHLGTIIGRRRFCKMVNIINSLKPDLVLFPGDIVDEDLAPVIKENLGDALLSIKSKYGILASTGNHEYIGGVEAATQYLQDHNVRVLRDSVLEIEDIQFIGREDRTINQFTSNKRKSLAELMQRIHPEHPIILMDHQPFRLNEAVQAGVDFQLSGHTHHGQLWPLNYVTEAVYEVSWGYKQIKNTHFYVSCGVGTWGPPVRLGNHPEILHIILKFSE